MNKILLTAVVISLSVFSADAFADNHGSDDHKGGKLLKMDTDGSGDISKAEFLTATEERFKKMDADGDGTITKAELKDARKNAKEKWKDRSKEKKESLDTTD